MGLKTINECCLQKDFLSQRANTFNLSLHKPFQALLSLQSVDPLKRQTNDFINLACPLCLFQVLDVLLACIY